MTLCSCVFMPLKIHNTLTKQTEKFLPMFERASGGTKEDEHGLVSFYHCGPTVYWVQHLGNMRAVVMADIAVRTLEYSGYTVKLVRNYTDVGHLTSDADEGEDKMEKGARREGVTPDEIADKYIKIFDEDIRMLNTRVPDERPRPTRLIPDIINMVQTLIDKGFAYTTDLAVYYDVSKARDYTRLSGQNLNKNISGEGSGEVSDPQKKHPADFALWVFKTGAHKNALQTWKSPFKSASVSEGEGFPGWHIECSVMALKYLGPTIDIHMGGIEHIPIHHTNEIAQSESANGVTFANYWLHNEHLLVDGAKMSKSEGTGHTLSDVTSRGYDPIAVRYFFLGAHYRSKQNFTFEALNGAQTALNKLRDILSEWNDKDGTIIQEYKERFTEKISDDFNTPQALAVMWDMVKSDKHDSNDKRATLLDFDRVLGLKLKEVKHEKINIPANVRKLLNEREQARANKDFELSDKLRDRIANKGFIVEDTPDGQKIKHG